MRFAVVAAAAATAGVATASYAPAPPSNGTAPVYVTEVVTAYTTYCPEATTLTHGQTTYTVSEATTLTIGCPGGCTVTKPVSSSVVTVCQTCSSTPAAPVTLSSVASSEILTHPYTSAVSTPAAPVETSGYAVPPVPYPSANGTIPATQPSGTGAPGTSTTDSAPISSYTGAATKAYSAAGAGFLAVLGLVAAL